MNATGNPISPGALPSSAAHGVGFPEGHIQHLKALEAGYWWYVGRLEWARRLIEPWAKERRGQPLRYADIGCGTGGFAAGIAAALSASEAVAMDAEPEALAHVDSSLKCVQADISRAIPLPWRAGLVTCMDVVEHLDDDGALLRRLADALEPGGLLVLSTAAHPALFSEWDRALGHRRRYTASALRSIVQSAGLRVTCLRHMWSFLTPAAPWRRLTPVRQTDLKFPAVPPWMNQALITASRAEWHLQRHLPLPFGTSLILSAVKP